MMSKCSRRIAAGSIVLRAVVLPVLVLCICSLSQTARAAEKENWKLGMQAYSFNRFTFYEAVDKNKALGMRYIEAYPGQRLSREKPDIKTSHDMPPTEKKEMLQKLREAGVRLMNYGVVGLPNNEAECRKVFNFAREMGIETIVSEPPEDAFDLLEKLCEEFKINVAIHNHPKPSHYWDPDSVLKVCKGRSKRIGACADTGHWMRSGVNPLEAIKKLGAAGRIISLHFKDLNEFGIRGAHDVIWGTGKADVDAILAELARQKFKGVFSIEYEHNWLNSMPEIAGCVSYFERTAAKLGQTDWKRLFNGKDLSGWEQSGKAKWVVEDGMLVGTQGANNAPGDLFTKQTYADFELMCTYKVEWPCNTGIWFRYQSSGKAYQADILEYKNPVAFSGTLYCPGKMFIAMNLDKELVNREGWNTMKVRAKGDHLEVWLNGHQVADVHDDTSDSGKIGFQVHPGAQFGPMKITVREILIKPL